MALKLTKDSRPVIPIECKTTNGDVVSIMVDNYIIPENAFMGNSTVKEVEIPNFIKEIRNGAFEGCTSLTTVQLPESIDIIRSTAFLGCTALETIVIPDSIKRIECWIDRRVASVTLYRPFSQKKLIELLVSGRGETEFYLSEEDYRSWRDWN